MNNCKDSLQEALQAHVDTLHQLGALFFAIKADCERDPNASRQVHNLAEVGWTLADVCADHAESALDEAE